MFSVVIPLYNKAPFIERTIRRVQAQSWGDFEAVIVDDGSTDEGGAVALKAIQRDPRFRYERVTNSGVSAARNRGAAMSSRPWIAFLDADDEWLPDFLAEVAKVVLNRPDAVLVSTNYFVRGKDAERPLSVPPGTVSTSVPYFDWSLRTGPPIWTSAAVVNRTHFEFCGGFDATMNMGEDIHLWVRMMRRGAYYFVHAPLAVYERADTASLSRVMSDRSVASRLKLIRFLSTQDEAGIVPEPFIRDVCNIHFNDLLQAGRYGEALKFAFSEPRLRLRYGMRRALRHVKERSLLAARSPRGALLR